MSVPDNYEIIEVVSSNATIRVDIDWEYQSIDELYVWQQDSETGDIFYFNLGDFAVVEKSDGSGDYIEVENVSTSEAVVFTARSTAKTQTYELENSEPLDPVALIEALDKAIKLIQENYSQLGTPDKRAITSVNPFEIPDKQTRKLTYVSFDENGDLRLDDEIDKIVGWAKEWAINPEDDLVSTEAGGNGVDDYSALHHSRKSEGFSDDSESSATDSANSATDSANSATASANSATASANSASASATSASNALASENKANLWAEEDEDVEVETGEYSAKHWAKKAEENAGGGVLFTEYFDGFDANTHRHLLYNGNVDTITDNSIWNVTGSATGTKPPFTTSAFFFLHTMMHGNTSDWASQMAYSMNSGDHEVFFRQKLSGTWNDWVQIANLNNAVPITGNSGNPMTGDLFMDDRIIYNLQSVRLGTGLVDGGKDVRFKSSSDPSQSDYSARIIRSTGIDGKLQIQNRGVGEIILDCEGGLINCSDSRLANTADALNEEDATNKRWVEARNPQSRWARVTNGNTTPTISNGNGITNIVRNSSGNYTITLSDALTSASPEIAINFQVFNQSLLNRTLGWDRTGSTATSIRFSTFSATAVENTDTFYIAITDLEL